MKRFVNVSEYQGKRFISDDFKSFEEAFSLKNQTYNYIETVELVKKDPTHDIKVIPFQSCPICSGTGQVLADGFISSVYQVCNKCNGAMVIPMHVLKQKHGH